MYLRERVSTRSPIRAPLRSSERNEPAVHGAPALGPQGNVLVVEHLKASRLCRRVNVVYAVGIAATAEQAVRGAVVIQRLHREDDMTTGTQRAG